jgi:predicted nuclease of predicted toxin-antitoxin system
LRFLVDSCVSRAVCDDLGAFGHDVLWVPFEFDRDPGDEVIIDTALNDDRVLITGDKDFGEWVFLRGKKQPPLIRLAAMSPANQVLIVISV